MNLFLITSEIGVLLKEYKLRFKYNFNHSQVNSKWHNWKKYLKYKISLFYIDIQIPKIRREATVKKEKEFL